MNRLFFKSSFDAVLLLKTHGDEFDGQDVAHLCFPETSNVLAVQVLAVS